MAMTAHQIEKAKREFARQAREPVEVEQIRNTLYAFGSELAMLRLFHVYRYSKDIQFGYSQNQKKWFFSMPYGK